MHSITSIIKKVSLYSVVLVLSSFSMLAAAGGSVFADPDPAPCTPPSSNQSGVHNPVGADAGTFTYQCDGPYAGFWTNTYYKYDPTTGQRYALYSPDYSYDCTSGVWTMTEYDYSPATGSYSANRVVPSTAPNLATGCPVPTTSATPTSDPSANPGDGGNGSGISNTGPGSSNGTNNNVNLNGSTTTNTGISLGNNLFSNATTGNTFVVGNTTGGSATSGDAQSIANVANLLQSSSNAFGPGTTTFTANINGDVNGDFMFDPSAIMGTGPGSSNAANNNLTINTNDANNTNAQINNTVDVGATTGDATVASNTTGGDATSGNAQAIVNLMNLINSTVSSGQSFVGTININGDLNGDILLPQGVLDQLLANTGPGSSNAANTNLTDNSTTTNNTNENVTNNLTNSALTGNATVSGNTNGGTASSGNATSNVTLLNLTGSNVVGKNDLLVFVNVLGKWVGMIMNAPAGSTAAELGGGISSTGPGSSNATSTTATDTSTTTNNANLGITNNIDAHAQTGDASVTNNTSGGNAHSGNASTAVNILNLEGSNLDLSNWFGVLFINVFGIWNGSFGINTSAGDPINNPTDNQVQAATQQSLVNSVKQFATFASTNTASGSASGTSSDAANSSVLGSSTTVAKKIASVATPTPDNAPHASFVLPIIGVSLAAIMLFASERGRFFGNKK